MQRWKLAGCLGAMCLLIVSTGLADVPAPQVPEVISSLIPKLADPDPNIRSDTVQRLIDLGEAARVVLRLALHTATPQTRPEMDRVLLHIHWVAPEDPDVIEQAFAGYADLDAEARCSRIEVIAPLQMAASTALLRVVLNDPSPGVRWVAADGLRLSLNTDPQTSKKLINILDGKEEPASAYLPPSENPAFLAAAAWACRDENAHRAEDLMQRALDLENQQTCTPDARMDFVYLWLIDRAEIYHDSGRMIQLLRKQAALTAWSDEQIPDAVANLIAAQAEYGPLQGFSDDLRGYRNYFAHPEMVYCIARLAERCGHPHVAALLNATALLMNGNSADGHFMTGTFLAQHGWDATAQRELKWCLYLSDGKSSSVYFQLSLLAQDQNDDLLAGQYLELWLQHTTDLNKIDRYGQMVLWSAPEVWAEVHWHYLRAARQTHDAAAVKTHLEKLLALDEESHIFQSNPNLVADVVPALQDQGLSDQADRIFNAGFEDLSKITKKFPDDPIAKNNLAWLCACAGKRLDEAAKLVEQAIAESPQDPAFLDTQAEIYMRMGNAAKAFGIETHALQIKPDDSYMLKQLEKYRAAARRSDH